MKMRIGVLASVVIALTGCVVVVDPQTLNGGGVEDAPLTCTTSAALPAQTRAFAKEMNFARTQPAAYADVIAAHYQTLSGQVFVQDGVRIRMKEGRPAVDEAIAALKAQAPRPALPVVSCLSRAAQDHVADIGPRGARTHYGRDGSDPSARASRYVSGRVRCGENISFGHQSPREIMIQLLVDDGVAGRGHRAAIYDARFKSMGLAIGPHASSDWMATQTLCFEDIE